MGKRSRRKKRQRKNQMEQLRKLLSGGKLYLNMDSKEWRTGTFNGLDIRGHCVGYRVPIGTTPEQEQAMVHKWREIAAIYNKQPIPIKPQPKPKQPKSKNQPIPQQEKFKLRVSHVDIELVGTEL